MGSFILLCFCHYANKGLRESVLRVLFLLSFLLWPRKRKRKRKRGISFLFLSQAETHTERETQSFYFVLGADHVREKMGGFLLCFRLWLRQRQRKRGFLLSIFLHIIKRREKPRVLERVSAFLFLLQAEWVRGKRGNFLFLSV
jgi:hypothetical protein